MKLYVGRKKTAKAVVAVRSGSGIMSINNCPINKTFFNDISIRNIIEDSINITSSRKLYNFKVKVSGGGLLAQAQAISFALAKFLINLSLAHKPILKKLGFLKSDARIKERKKTGKPKARKSFQFSKR
ncbi:30S ribosomal protein S9 [Candidatus Pinguicoccus supinus]|uniref:Small ribosomal subunit protein uS9 n=1 Tax=Candidatus Pinguicoccus supinus TaxID=2529394 RepID=A0A7T0BRN3_9BACT|nr:30S ribosomal protein S9 [Candidatus Pinguicoccus supinus]